MCLVSLSKLLLLLTALKPSFQSTLPDKLVVAYQSWSECDDKVISAVQNGVNIVIWFAANLESSEDGSALMAGGPNRTCVEEKIGDLAQLGYGRDKVTHLISVGGWDASHPDTSNSAQEYFDAFEAFSDGLYDGLDWDLEGNDALTSQWNYFSKECLLLMGDLSQLLHDAGYIVSMAPPESYLDIQTTEFSKYVNLTYPSDDWNIDPPFSYHGHNTYALPLAMHPDAFDFINFQIYETKSHASYNTTILGTEQADYLVSYINMLLHTPLTVDFSTDEDFSSLGLQTIDIQDKIVVGFIAAGGIGGPITAANATKAYQQVEEMGEGNIRGWFYWCLADDGDGLLPGVLSSAF
ncbi:hypothetical protein TrST_g9946 [Triparma strigata]|uniref:Chitinase n=1 Tax=Triparma strigata TaxID=1606541 RepID=A0A9W7B871_9STRA|nr:hypothetical protein TrST_g9946 [Triparma strigata]